MWGVKAAWMRRHEVTEELILDAAARVVELGWCQPGQRVGITAGLPSGVPGTTSLLQIQRALSAVEGGLGAAELGRRRVAEDPLARDPVPVAGRAQLAHHGERQRLGAPAEEVVGRQVLVAHLRVVARARVAHVDHDLGRDLGRQLDLGVARVPPGDVLELAQDLLGRVAVGLGEEAAGVQVLDQRARPRRGCRAARSRSSYSASSAGSRL